MATNAVHCFRWALLTVSPRRCGAVGGIRVGRRSEMAKAVPVEVRLERKSDRSGGPLSCWLWKGAVGGSGYGSTSVLHHTVSAHRLSYETHVGPIPDGMVIDHKCRNKLCINPAHLEAVTTRENLLRGVGPQAANHAKTHCKRGHPLSGDNLLVYRSHVNGRTARACATCQRVRAARGYARKKARGL